MYQQAPFRQNQMSDHSISLNTVSVLKMLHLFLKRCDHSVLCGAPGFNPTIKTWLASWLFAIKFESVCGQILTSRYNMPEAEKLSSFSFCCANCFDVHCRRLLDQQGLKVITSWQTNRPWNDTPIMPHNPAANRCNAWFCLKGTVVCMFYASTMFCYMSFPRSSNWPVDQWVSYH